MPTRFKAVQPTRQWVHPLLRFIWSELETRKIPQADFARTMGINSRTLRRWRDGEATPPLEFIEAALGHLGYRISITKMLGE